MSKHIRGLKQIREFEYKESMKLGHFEKAQEIADANQTWYENEAQRWADLAGEATLKLTLNQIRG